VQEKRISRFPVINLTHQWYSWGHRLEQTKNIFTVAQKRRNLIFSQIEAQKCCFVSWDYVYIACCTECSKWRTIILQTYKLCSILRPKIVSEQQYLPKLIGLLLVQRNQLHRCQNH